MNATDRTTHEPFPGKTVSTSPLQPTLAKVLAAVFSLWAIGTLAQTNPNSELLNLLQKKGLLTEQEVNQLREETSLQATNHSQPKISFADWITAVKLSGDFRGRFEQNNAENNSYDERDRFRYRLRLGAVASMWDNFDVGVRLASGNPQVNSGGTLVGGQPITANTDMSSLESRKFIWVDLAYAQWTPIKNNDWMVSATFGKMDNPFQLSNMIWDYDIDPEGAALQIAFNAGERHTLKVNGAFFVLDELNQALSGVPSINPQRDPYVYGGQLLLESKWSSRVKTSIGVAAFDIVDSDSLSSKVQPFYNSGNTRNSATGSLVYHYNPVIATASATYTTKVPVRVWGEYMDNPGAPQNNQAYRVGFTFGKAWHKNGWELSYRYQRLEADAWFDALVDDDNGAYYATGNPQLVGTGKASGWFGGTNVKGHLLQASYSFTDFLNLSFTYYLNDLIIGAPHQSSDAGHFMVDMMWKF